MDAGPKTHRVAVLCLAVGACLAAIGIPPALAAPTDTLVQVSADPFTTPGFEHATEVEPAIGVDGRTVVAAFQVGRAQDGGSVDIGVAMSSNAGATWTAGMLARTTTAVGGHYGRASDPSVAHDTRANAWLVAYLGLTIGGPFDEPTSSAIVVVRSSNGGSSFGQPITIARAPRGIIYDKPWIACDEHRRSPNFGRCYAVWDELGLRAGPRDVVLLSTSFDGGMHWTSPVRTVDHVHGFGGVPVVRPDGSVIVVYLDVGRPLHPYIGAFTSTDGGARWGHSTTIAVPRRSFTRFVVARDPGLPSVAIDDQGSIWVAWSDCRFEPGCPVDDVVVARSVAGGRWSRPVPIAKGTASTRASLLTPALAAGGRGRHPSLALLYYAVSGIHCGASFQPKGCTVTIGATTSSDGGGDWTPPTTIGWPMKVRWFAPTRAGYMWGDYVSSVIVEPRKTLAVLPLAKRPTRVLDVGMYASVVGLKEH
jgi:hypothetical protein